MLCYEKPAATPTFCKRNCPTMHQIKDMNFLSFHLTIGNQHFVPKKHVNLNIFKNKVCTMYKHDPRQLLTPKEMMDHY